MRVIWIYRITLLPDGRRWIGTPTIRVPAQHRPLFHETRIPNPEPRHGGLAA